MNKFFSFVNSLDIKLNEYYSENRWNDIPQDIIDKLNSIPNVGECVIPNGDDVVVRIWKGSIELLEITSFPGDNEMGGIFLNNKLIIEISDGDLIYLPEELISHLGQVNKYGPRTYLTHFGEFRNKVMYEKDEEDESEELLDEKFNPIIIGLKAKMNDIRVTYH